jgi:hypothetical protein
LLDSRDGLSYRKNSGAHVHSSFLLNKLEKNAVLAKKMKNFLTRTQGHVLSLQKIS